MVFEVGQGDEALADKREIEYMTLEFKDHPNPRCSNQVAYFDESKRDYASFNATPGMKIGFFQSDGGCSETALKINDVWMILNGDWRQEYCEAFESGGVEACVKMYRDNPEHRSTWSTDASDVDDVLEWLKQRAETT